MGLRKNEAIIIPWTAVDFKNNVIHIYRPKVKNQSLIPMTNRVRVLMERRFKTKRNDWVFPSRDGKTHRTGDVQAITAAIKRAGVNDPKIVKQTGDTITTHLFRKYFAATLISNGVPIYTVSQLLGHSDIKTTIQAYSFLINNDEFEKAIGFINDRNSVKPKLKVV